MRPTDKQLQNWLDEIEADTTEWDAHTFPKYWYPEYEPTLAAIFRELLELRKLVEVKGNNGEVSDE